MEHVTLRFWGYKYENEAFKFAWKISIEEKNKITWKMIVWLIWKEWPQLWGMLWEFEVEGTSLTPLFGTLSQSYCTNHVWVQNFNNWKNNLATLWKPNIEI